MAVTITLRNKNEYRLMYSSIGFKEDISVEGYLIYPNLIKSEKIVFTELGDGIYTSSILHNSITDGLAEKCGLVMKENGETKLFEIIQIVK